MHFRSRLDGQHYPLRGSLYGREPRSKLYSRKIQFANLNEAHEAVRFANEKWDTYTRRDEKVHLVQAMNEASNRAKVMSQNDRLSASERKKASEVHKVLREWVTTHKGKETINDSRKERAVERQKRAEWTKQVDELRKQRPALEKKAGYYYGGEGKAETAQEQLAAEEKLRTNSANIQNLLSKISASGQIYEGWTS